MNAAYSLHRALEARADDKGDVRTTVAELVALTGFSKATIHRSLNGLVESGAIRRRSKDGRSGGLLIRLETVSKRSHETVSKRSQNETVRDVVTQGGALKGPTPLLRDRVSPNPVTETLEPSWFVCCIWYADDGSMWCHGDDGIPTYIPCRSQAEAEALAKKHRETLHKDKNEPGMGRFPCVDICKNLGAGKTLHARLGMLG